ncbi:MAG: hypothetical protein GY749_03430 [Desulfobacteraceae bacterium]|nr:hypothetical protein [Desulfobacteraceae bacterium]
MEKDITSKIIIYFVLFFAMAFSTGCAGQKPQTGNNAVAEIPENSVSAPKNEAQREKIIVSDSSDTDVISTPFGKVRRKKAGQVKQKPDSKTPPSRIKESDIPKDTRKVDTKKTPPASGAEKPVTSKKRKSRTRSRSSSGKSSPIVLNFDNADLQEVIRTLAELLHINYIVDPNVRGSVTIHTAGNLNKNDLFPVFFQILEANSLTAVKEGSLYKILKFKDASRMPIISSSGEPGKYVSPGERIIIQIIPLDFISVQEMTKLLTPFISAEGTIISHGDSNTLLVVDKSINIRKVLRLVKVFDVNLFEKVNHRFYSLKYVEAKEVATTVTDIIASYGIAKDDVKITSIERLNTILAVSSKPLILNKIHEFIEEIDIPVHDLESRIYVYSVKNGEAEELSDILGSVFKGETSQKEKSTTSKTTSKKNEPKKAETKSIKTPFGTIVREKGTMSVPRKSQQLDSAGSTTLKSEIHVTPDKVRNVLIIEAVPQDYRIVENLLKRLDVLPRQVLIELTLAEITLDNSTDLGIDWEYDKSINKGIVSGSLGSSGLKYMLGLTDKWKAKVSAYATDKKVNILSSPSILASDNKEAKINISTEIPVKNVEYKSGTDADIIETSIQYRNTGIIMSVTPHINEHGLVSMDLSQEISEQSPGSEGQETSFYKRTVNTSLTVKDGQTIVIAGLMKENKKKELSGAPCLINMPVLNYIFGKKTDTGDKTELIIFITPRVIASLDDVDIVTEEFKSKMGNVLKKDDAIER